MLNLAFAAAVVGILIDAPQNRRTGACRRYGNKGARALRANAQTASAID